VRTKPGLVQNDQYSPGTVPAIEAILLTMAIAATPVPLSEATAPLSELARRVRQKHERIALTRKPAEGMEVMQGPTNRPLALAGVP
jgi:hypothetical protein